MDARKTGALITARRKALGLTQKELAERLAVSDKAVSKWETGAGYPEVTMLPLLAATLGITVDELLAGETRAEGAEEELPAQAEPAGLTAARRQFAAEKLAAADGWLLLACCLGVVVYVWFAVSIGALGLPRLLLLCILFAACAIWHSGRVRRLNGYAAPDDLCVSRRRAALLIGGFAGIALLFGAAVIAAPFSGLLEFERGRYEIAVETGSFFSGQLLGLFLLLFAALGALAACCLRMTAQTRLYPALPIVVSALPGLGAAVLLYLRVSLIVSFSPPAFEQALITVEGDLNASMAQLLSTARTVWIAATVLVIALCVVLRLIRRRGAPLPLLLPCAALQSLLWYWTGTNDVLFTLTFPSVLSTYGKGEITIFTAGWFFVLMASVLIWAICTLLSGLRRRQKPPAAPAEPPAV